MFIGVAETIAASVLCCGVGIVQCLQRHLLITPIDNTLEVLFKPRVCLHGGMGDPRSLRWGNPLIHIVSLEFDHLYMIGGGDTPNVTSPIWGPLPPSKQALRKEIGKHFREVCY